MSSASFLEGKEGRRAVVIAAVAALLFAAVLVLSWAGKAVCIDGENGFWRVTRYCYSDISILWSFRGFDVDALPYAGAPAGYVTDYVFEYPPGLGFGAWFIALLTDTRRGFFTLTGLTLAASAMATFAAATWVVLRDQRDPTRLLLLALSPALLLFAFQNWDLWAVAPAFLAVAALASGRRELAAVLIGVGFAMKWWPGLLGLLLVWGPWAAAHDLPRAERFRAPMIAAGVGLLAQVPAILASPAGWVEAHLFHARRTTNLESGLQGIHDLGQYLAPSGFWDGGWWTLVSIASLGVLVGGLALVGRRLRDDAIDPQDAALAIVALFLLSSRVASPQFVLWLVPFVVVSRVSVLPLVVVEALNAVNWLLYGPALAGGDRGFLHAAQAVGLLRRVAVGWLVYEALRRSRLPAPSTASAAKENPAPVAGNGAGAGVGAGVGAGASD